MSKGTMNNDRKWGSAAPSLAAVSERQGPTESQTESQIEGQTIADVAFRAGRRLATDPNICGVGYGVKLRAGAVAGGASLVFMVREKLSSPAEVAARGSWSVPEAIEGFTTDVVE